MNPIIMTVFLWHLTALVIVALHPLGFGQATTPTLRWWAERVIWIAAPATILAVLVALFGRFEQPKTMRPT